MDTTWLCSWLQMALRQDSRSCAASSWVDKPWYWSCNSNNAKQHAGVGT